MTNRFKVSCDDCSFEDEITAKEQAEALAQDHYVETGHNIIAVEYPRKVQSR